MNHTEHAFYAILLVTHSPITVKDSIKNGGGKSQNAKQNDTTATQTATFGSQNATKSCQLPQVERNSTINLREKLFQ